jgi:hypothetical protein
MRTAKHSMRVLGSLTILIWMTASAAKDLVVADFSGERPGVSVPAGWRLAKLPGVSPTRFRIGEADGIRALGMDASNAGAALFRPLDVDPERRPVLEWRWRVDSLVEGADIRTKKGDDLPARLYVMFDYPLGRLSLIEQGKIRLARTFAGDLVPAAAICYVWDGALPEGTSLWNPYTERVRVIVVESGDRNLGRWVSERRDVAADFRAAFGESPPRISGVAIGADTDQTGGSSSAWFGGLRLSEE